MVQATRSVIRVAVIYHPLPNTWLSLSVDTWYVDADRGGMLVIEPQEPLAHT